MKFVNLQDYMPVLIEIMDDGKEVSLVVSGGSMIPFLVPRRDTVIITKPSETYKKGDLIFFQRSSGEYIMHRIHHIDKEEHLYLVGDAQQEIEGPIEKNQVVGCVRSVIRKNKRIDSNNHVWKFFATVWLWCLPVRDTVMNFYTKIKNKSKI